MKNNKIKFIGLSLVLLLAIAGCTPNNNMRNLGTQTRLNNNGNNRNNRWMDNTNLNTRDRLNTNLNNGLNRNNNLNNGMVRNDTNLNSGMNTNDQLNNNTNLVNRANVIAQRVTALPEVERASVLISGDRAVVGCDVREDINNTIDANLRNKIEAAVRAADRNIKTVSITSDPNLNTRIRTLSTQITNGNPISSFARDIEDIIQRITTPVR